MDKLHPFFILVMVLILSGSVSTAAGVQQDSATAEKVTSLLLGSQPTPPGLIVFLPLVLSAAAGLEVGTIESEVTFPNTLLSFEGIANGPSVESAGAELNALVQPENKNPEESVLKITVVSKPGESIAGGVVAYLNFKVADQAPLGTIVKLRHVAKALTVGDPQKPLEPFVVRGGIIEVKVTDSPFFACFFYMH